MFCRWLILATCSTHCIKINTDCPLSPRLPPRDISSAPHCRRASVLNINNHLLVALKACSSTTVPCPIGSILLRVRTRQRAGRGSEVTWHGKRWSAVSGRQTVGDRLGNFENGCYGMENEVSRSWYVRGSNPRHTVTYALPVTIFHCCAQSLPNDAYVYPNHEGSMIF
jgi:hypothetical protein